ncbi:flagellar basal-body MS-ring/collar protein FliF [Blastococcus xanthinilyticus]|uniref:Flagellar M-ring protein n=1 Tax=Blastococcus xanthinilyticus TaxID=1564164 RepID=A0A5S5CTL5_9ACTN|nr:flagellar basal-body MS-ring/collar protein FliF [Blastococcus xanthinilyticus]TYP86298.1 flagellar M-ring protein FliF [Blastococcus xanthinilyticus]
MTSALAGTLERARSTFDTVGLGQKVVIGLLLVGLTLGGFVFYSWITAPTQAPLFTNLATSDAAAIVDELDAAGVANEVTDGGGTILVDKDSVYDLRLDMSAKGLPAGQDTGYALLDEQGITTSEFQQQVTYQRALEGELANTLESLDGVGQATVHITPAGDEVFVTEKSEPTASVLLQLAPGTSLSGEQIMAVTNLVASSVKDMTPDQVTVADSTGQVLSAPGTGVTAAAGDARAQVETDYEARLSANAQKILDSVVGPGRSVVSVRADADLAERETTSETYTYDQGVPPVSEQRDVEEYTGGGAPVGGILGPENMPDAAENAGGAESNYSKESTTTNNAVGKTTTVEQGAPGGLNRLTVSVVMDDAVAGNLNQQQMRDLMITAVGLDEARGDDITVASLPFDTTAADAAAAAMEAAREAEAGEQMWSMIRTGGIAAGIALVVLVVWLRSRRREEVEEDYEPLELDDDMLAELDRLRVASTRQEVQIDNAALELEAAERAKVRGEISSMVSERPDEVAAMLRGWLSETKS